MAAGNAIMLSLTGILMVEPFLNMLPKPDDLPERTTVVTVGYGSDDSGVGPGGHELGGNIPGVRTFDVAGHPLGRTKANTGRGPDAILKGGATATVNVLAKDGYDGVSPYYLAISAGGNDAICISFIQMVRPDLQVFGWTGDIGKACGAPWYPSNREVNTNHTKPACVWIDGDGRSGSGPNGINFKGIGLHMTDFTGYDGTAISYQADPSIMCKSKPRFWMYPELTIDDCIPAFDPILEYNDDKTDKDISKVVGVEGTTRECLGPVPYGVDPDLWDQDYAYPSKRTTEAAPFMEGHLVSSASPDHSAIEVCNSESSRGPDFLSLPEGVFCDMAAKKTYPVCTTYVKDTCFDTERKTLRVGAGPQRRGEIIPRKEYHKVGNWGI
ncbi:hypothetical protein BJ875DRAFT_485887 [Amylocarpus encephaloides]|uniref:Uncharacterized protein n=1 Tax=Amylocarpus encephaloides TaxID=45428 RepID=A0A9P7YFP7_9HELO|nr:hypothetical protein BJ875DRAFT_485887 [Amylocarpus encephaloides]